MNSGLIRLPVKNNGALLLSKDEMICQLRQALEVLDTSDPAEWNEALDVAGRYVSSVDVTIRARPRYFVANWFLAGYYNCRHPNPIKERRAIQLTLMALDWPTFLTETIMGSIGRLAGRKNRNAHGSLSVR